MDAKLEVLRNKIANFKLQHRPKKYKGSVLFGSSLTVALEVVVSVAIGFLMGFYLDKACNFKFTFKVAGCILGGLASLVSIYRTLSRN